MSTRHLKSLILFINLQKVRPFPLSNHPLTNLQTPIKNVKKKMINPKCLISETTNLRKWWKRAIKERWIQQMLGIVQPYFVLFVNFVMNEMY